MLPIAPGHFFLASIDTLAVIVAAVTGIILSSTLLLSLYRKSDTFDEQSGRRISFPARLFVLSAFLTFSTMAWIVSDSIYSDRALRTVIQEDQAIKNIENQSISFERSRASGVVEKQAAHRLYGISRNLHAITYIVIAMVLALAVAWFFCLRSLKRWRVEMQAARKEMGQVSETLREEKARLQTILDNIATGIITIDPQGIVRSVNIGAETIFGRAASDIIGAPLTTLIPDIAMLPAPEGRAPTHIRLSGILDRRRELTGLRKNGETFPLTLYVRTIAQNGRLLCIGFINDITEQKRKEEELNRARKTAEAANETKSDFLANTSHELRTPLNSIIGMTRLLCESPALDREHHELADVAYRSSANLLGIVNDILDLSKIEAGEMQLERIGFDPVYAADSVIETLRQIADEKRIEIVKDYGTEAIPAVLGDPTRFSRILINLVSNAVKYTEKGYIHVHMSVEKLSNARVKLLVKVEDTGIGIGEDKLRTIFDKFVQADSSTTRKYGGSGLGLTITKQLVELMGGTIGVESSPGRGSVFWFMVPFDVTNMITTPKRRLRRKQSSGTLPAGEIRLLIAEDHVLNQALIKKLTEQLGIRRAHIVGNGLEAVKFCQRESPDLILMDCHMPEKNGYDATRDIRALERGTGRRVPIIAMTANAMVGDREKCLRYGMDEYISKPIDSDELRDILGQWIRFESAPAPMPHGLNLANLRSFTGGNIATEKGLIKLFIQQSDRNMDVLAALESGGEGSAWSEAAHMLKGGAASIGAEALRALSEEAQYFSGTPDGQRALFEKISAAYSHVKDELHLAGLLDC